MPDDLSPWTWILAVIDEVEAMDWWTATGDDRTPLSTHGYPLGWLDRCDCANGEHGQLLVTAGDVFYAGERFPDQDQITSRLGADAGRWAVNLTIEYARCRPVIDERGTLPTITELRTFAAGLYADGMAIWRAFQCATDVWRTEPGMGPVVSKGWGPIRRDIGQCAGFTYELTAAVKSCQDC